MQPMTKREAAAATVAAIRAKYPEPVVNPDPLNEDEYCVVIAAVRCGYLRTAAGKGRYYNIVNTNDRGDFARAWSLLEDALAA